MAGMATFDVIQYKANVRAEWRDAAAGWRSWFDVLEAEHAGRAVSRALIELAGIGPGDAVLDVASGYGEPGLTAARVVGPGGRVVCADIAPEMLAVGRARVLAERLANVEFISGDTDELALDAASFDAVVSRQGLQYLPDVAAALVRLHGFLRPHGRIAAAVWGPAASVQFAAPVPIIRSELHLPPPPPGLPGPFALGDAGQLASLVEKAGFSDVRTGAVIAVYELESPSRCTQWLRDVAPPIAGIVDRQPAAVQRRVWSKVTEGWAPFTTSDGHVRLECQAHWVAGTR